MPHALGVRWTVLIRLPSLFLESSSTLASSRAYGTLRSGEYRAAMDAWYRSDELTITHLCETFDVRLCELTVVSWGV